MIKTPVTYSERALFTADDAMFAHLFPKPTIEDADGEHIATCINSHTALVAVAEAADAIADKWNKLEAALAAWRKG